MWKNLNVAFWELLQQQDPPSDLYTWMILDKKTQRCLKCLHHKVLTSFFSNSTMVASEAPIKGSYLRYASASFLHYKIIRTQI